MSWGYDPMYYDEPEPELEEDEDWEGSPWWEDEEEDYDGWLDWAEQMAARFP